ncbi:MAG: transposase [Planctomycetes bacterium]|nr:transposase [Planctomycetota bacterium]
MKTGEFHTMAPAGFEADRNTLKFRCPAVYYGIECKSYRQCPAASCVRIPLEQDRRIFTPVARNSPKWDRLYNNRTAVERVNSRLDVSFGFEEHFIRGLAKMQLRCGLAFIVMLAMAVGRIKHNQHEHMRSLVRAA